MTDLSLEKMLSRWEKSTREISGNLTANDYLPPEIRRRLLVENYNLIGDMDFEELSFTPLCQELSDIEGMDILSGLQKLKKEGNLTVFRAIRFPTISRIRDTVHDLGLSMPNYEQERIIQLYGSSKYAEKRETMQEDPNFWTQPQERVVDGMPVFSLVNDALQIHRAYRSERDRVLMIGIHVPHKLIES